MLENPIHSNRTEKKNFVTQMCLAGFPKETEAVTNKWAMLMKILDIDQKVTS